MFLIIKFWLLYVLNVGLLSKITTPQYTNATYLQQDETLSKSIQNGELIYGKYCARCHKTNGEGSKNYPPLANSDWLLTTKLPKSIHAVKYGLKGNIIVNGKNYKRTMPKSKLKDQEIADVMNYIMNNWGNKQTSMITKKVVTEIKQ
ncbi:c-type cytochrome [Aquimarina agarilytica]|uniref:c-type cytochrome n=1 Tax=Aquimarina agarilytica TaxID=1087449 RepID=UPI000287C173|nr:cytochrome c [Aquimarina agarilytica]